MMFVGRDIDELHTTKESTMPTTETRTVLDDPLQATIEETIQNIAREKQEYEANEVKQVEYQQQRKEQIMGLVLGATVVLQQALEKSEAFCALLSQRWPHSVVSHLREDGNYPEEILKLHSKGTSEPNVHSICLAKLTSGHFCIRIFCENWRAKILQEAELEHFAHLPADFAQVLQKLQSEVGLAELVTRAVHT